MDSPLEVLLVEDTDADLELHLRILQRAVARRRDAATVIDLSL